MLQPTSFKYWHRKFDLAGQYFTGHSNIGKAIGCLILPLVIIFIPREWIPLDGLTVVHQRAMFIFTLAAIFWIFEPIPIFATSMLVIFLELVLLSDSGFIYALVGKEESSFGTLMRYQDIMATLASPIILLFLGGFFMAIAAAKFQLDQKMAQVFIKPFGTSPKMVMLGIMIITAVFSMFMSNTATTAMMLSVLVPVLGSMDAGDKGKIGILLAVPVAANLGGLGTPIGTPPNAIALEFLPVGHGITFGKWMLIGVPYVILMILISWFILLKMFPTTTKSIHLKIEAGPNHGYKPIVIYATFAITVLLWLTDFIHGMNSYVVAMFPIIIFLSLGIVNKDDLKSISWDVLWLVAGGIALGMSLTQTGLADVFVSNIPFSTFPLIVLFLITAGLGILIANFMSNTATANLLIPIIAVIGSSVPALQAIGGGSLLILIAAFSVSLGMCLPISTPPNALAYSTGLITTKDLTRTGLMIGGVGLLMAFIVLFINKYLGLV